MSQLTVNLCKYFISVTGLFHDDDELKGDNLYS